MVITVRQLRRFINEEILNEEALVRGVAYVAKPGYKILANRNGAMLRVVKRDVAMFENERVVKTIYFNDSDRSRNFFWLAPHGGQTLLLSTSPRLLNQRSWTI